MVKNLSKKNKCKFKIDFHVNGESFLTKPNKTIYMARNIIKKITRITPVFSTTGGTSFGSKIIEYKGKVITRKEAEENPKYDNGKAIYLFNLNKRYDLDGDFKFNTARLINHSCNPNCEVTGTGLKVWVYAIKDIKKRRRIFI